jgi:hypothetical protein
MGAALQVPLSGVEITMKLVSRSAFDVGLPGVLPTWVYMALSHQSNPEEERIAVALTPLQARELATTLAAMAEAIESAR